MIAHTFLWDASFIEPFKNLSNRSLNSFCLLKGHEINARLSSDSFFADVKSRAGIFAATKSRTLSEHAF